MKKLSITLSLMLGLSISMCGQASKASIKVGTLTAVAGEGGAWQKVMTANIKTSVKKDFLLGVSMETNLVTNTVVASKNYEKSQSDALASIEVLVTVDRPSSEAAPNENAAYAAAPGVVTFDKRQQTLIAKLDGFSCTDLNLDNNVTYDECTLTPEEIQLILTTLASHHFNFAKGDVGVGEHVIEVWARITTSATGSGPTLGSATADAFVGKGSVSVEEVRLVNTGSGASVNF